MKKFLSLILALCMALAAFSVLAEEGWSGDWYLLMSSLTAGTAVLNADGTCTIDMTSGEEQMHAEGTWTAGDNGVTLTVEGSPMEFISDGTNLVAQEMMLVLSREPGKLTIQEMTAYTTDGTLPEGMTEEEMTLVFLEIMGAMMSAGGETDEPASTNGEEVSLTVLAENYIVREGYSGPEHWVYLQLQNDTASDLYLSNASVVMTDADGNEAGKANYVYTAGSRYLEPGEITYISLKAEITEGMTPVSYSYSVDCRTPDNYTRKDSTVAVGEPELEALLVEADSYQNVLKGRVSITNTSSDLLEEPRLLLVLKDADGKIIDLDYSSVYNIGITAGSTIIVTELFNSNTANYCITNGITPATVEAYAWLEEPW